MRLIYPSNFCFVSSVQGPSLEPSDGVAMLSRAFIYDVTGTGQCSRSGFGERVTGDDLHHSAVT